MMQVLGHMDRIASRGDYSKYMVAKPEGGIGDHVWTETIDVRKPEAVQFVCDLLDEVCSAFPGKYINIDVTEIADYGFTSSGASAEELPALMAGYINQLNKVCNKHDMSLSVAQSPLRAEGHLNGLGKVLDLLDKDINVGSYYTAEFYGGWDYDYPLMQEKGRDFWVNPWLASHSKFMPDVQFSMDFTDITIERGLRYGTMGSITCDWGDFRHIQLPGVVIYPSMYHFAACWNGKGVDRKYFDKAFCLAVFGAKNDTAARGIMATGNVNQVPVERFDENNNVFSRSNYMTGNYNLGHHFMEIFDDVLDNDFMSKIANPRARAEEVGKRADEGMKLMTEALADVRMNKDFYEEILWSGKPYQLISERLLLRDKFLTKQINPDGFAEGLKAMAGRYREMKDEYSALYTRGCRVSAEYEANINAMNNTLDAALALAEKQKNPEK